MVRTFIGVTLWAFVYLLAGWGLFINADQGDEWAQIGWLFLLCVANVPYREKT